MLYKGIVIILSVTLKSPKDKFISAKPQFYLQLFYQCSKSKLKCLGLQVAREQMDDNLKKMGRFLQVYRVMSRKPL